MGCRLLKALWEKQKMLVNTILSFFQNTVLPRKIFILQELLSGFKAVLTNSDLRN